MVQNDNVATASAGVSAGVVGVPSEGESARGGGIGGGGGDSDIKAGHEGHSSSGSSGKASHYYYSDTS